MNPPAPEARAALSTVIAHDLASIRRLDAELMVLPPSLHTVSADAVEFRDLAATAYLLHNIYNALENSFSQTSRTFENHLTDSTRWHRELLAKMFLAIPGVRPAVLPEPLRRLLSDLMGFRHVFRHSYNFDLDPRRLRDLANDWQGGKERLFASLDAFTHFLLAPPRGASPDHGPADLS